MRERRAYRVEIELPERNRRQRDPDGQDRSSRVDGSHVLSQVPEAVEKAAEGGVRSGVQAFKKRTKGEKGVASAKLTRWRKRQDSGRKTVHRGISDPRAQVVHLRKTHPI